MKRSASADSSRVPLPGDGRQRFTSGRWLIHLTTRRAPLSVPLASLTNEQQVRRALEAFAQRNTLAVVDGPIYTEMGEDSP